MIENRIDLTGENGKFVWVRRSAFGQVCLHAMDRDNGKAILYLSRDQVKQLRRALKRASRRAERGEA